MSIREKVAHALFWQKWAMKDLENAENIAPKIPTHKIEFKASPYTKAPRAPKVKVKNKVNMDPSAGIHANPASRVPIPTPVYNPAAPERATAPVSMLPPVAPILPTLGSK